MYDLHKVSVSNSGLYAEYIALVSRGQLSLVDDVDLKAFSQWSEGSFKTLALLFYIVTDSSRCQGDRIKTCMKSIG